VGEAKNALMRCRSRRWDNNYATLWRPSSRPPGTHGPLDNKRPQPKLGPVRSGEPRGVERGSSPARCTKARLSFVTELDGSGANSLESSRPRYVTQLSCINNPSTAHKIKATRIVAARYSVIVMMFSPIFPATLNRNRYCADSSTRAGQFLRTGVKLFG